jgi:heme-based aerotactic transducer
VSNPFYDEIRSFLGLSDADVENLAEVAPLVHEHGPGITDRFYQVLASNATTAAQIAGRVERLKRTHGEWMRSLVSGSIPDEWFDAQVRIGHVHVVVGVSPLHVELTYSLLRDAFTAMVLEHVSDRSRALSISQSLTKVLDISLALVNHAYAEERLRRLSAFTGFSRKLIENCIAQKPR